MRWVLSSLAVVAAGVVGMAMPERDAPGRPTLDTAPQAAPQPSGLPTALPARQTFAKARIDPFAPRDWTPRPPPAPVQAAPQPPPAPSVPPNPYRFAGTVHYGGSLKAVFIRDEKVHIARQGETLEGGYGVRSVAREAATLVYTPLGIEQRMALASDIAPSPLPPGSPLASASAPDALVRIAAKAPPTATQPPAATAGAR